MILREFPNLEWLKKQADARFLNQKAWDGTQLDSPGWPTVILNTRTKGTVRDNIRGPLSLFMNISGESIVTADSKRTIVKEGFFCITNASQHYTLEINSKQPAETFNIHFGDYFAEKVWSALSQGPDNLLDNKSISHSFEFRNRLVPLQEVTKNIVQQIRLNQHAEKLFLEEQLYSLFQSLLSEEKRIERIQQQMPALKSSTKKEIIQRLLMATDYIYTFYDRKISLEELAQACCLSKFHFLRLFKIAFKKTPYQFMNEVRVLRAQQLLSKSRLEVKEIAHLTGFDSAATFSRMFYNQSGLYPTQFRGRQ
jgi:AraC family transcriptional regulator